MAMIFQYSSRWETCPTLRLRCKLRQAWLLGGGRPSLGKWERECHSQGHFHDCDAIPKVLVHDGHLFVCLFVCWEMRERMPFSRSSCMMMMFVCLHKSQHCWWRWCDDFEDCTLSGERKVPSYPQGSDLGDSEIRRHCSDWVDPQDCLRCQHWKLWVATGETMIAMQLMMIAFLFCHHHLQQHQHQFQQHYHNHGYAGNSSDG